MPYQAVFALTAWLAAVIAAALVCARWFQAKRRLQARLSAEDGLPPDVAIATEPGGIAGWLFAAGFRGQRATAAFLGATLLCGLVGLVLILVLPAGLGMRRLELAAHEIPGGVGEVFVPVILAAPWAAVAILAGIPTMVVRRARRRRVREVEQDLPIILELLATLAEAGLGFDAAMERVRESLPPERVMAREFRAFHRDNLAGRPRIDSLRWLGRRVAVSCFSIFISAVVHADQIGAGLADVLKVQAEDLRRRRKEQALAAASSAPVKLLAPMIICFIPGIVTAALGPTIFEIVQALDAILLGPR